MLTEFVGVTSPKMKSLKLLYSLIRKLGAVRINILSEMTGYKHTTCARLLDELAQVGLVQDSGLGESSGGRKPLMYEINPNAHYLIGVEVTNLYTTVLLLNLSLDILGSKKLKMNEQYTGEYTLNYVTECIDLLLAEHHIHRDKLLGIGVGVLDPIDPERGAIHHHSFKAEGWDLNIVEYLTKQNNTLVLLDNGTNLAALAEYRKNHWKDKDSLVFVSSDMGIRCGVIQNGRMVSHKNGMEDAFGHIIVDIHGQRCSCGSYGCLQAYSSLPAIRNEVIRQMKRGKYSSLQEQVADVEEIDFHHILDTLEQEDPLCLEVIKEAAYYFGIGLTNLIFLLHPDVVVCGGTLVPKPLFYEVASDAALKRMAYYPNSHIEITKATTDYNSVAQGAGCMILDYFTEEILP
ncbi:ROK family protein [Paenibacillus terrigena]|uniref:ROK family protein n=1 Tax=Paenibacillus terrigena TaxID=369333 RepID=UPI00037BD4E3|nr:ROK family protein [Paenibacillus terrigena]